MLTRIRRRSQPTGRGLEPSVLLPALPDLIWGSVAFVIILAAHASGRFVPRINAALDARSRRDRGRHQARRRGAGRGRRPRSSKYNAQLAEARAEAGAHPRAGSRRRHARSSPSSRSRRQARPPASPPTRRRRSRRSAQPRSSRCAPRSARSRIDLASGVIGESLTDDKKAAAIVDRFLADLDGRHGTKAKAGK